MEEMKITLERHTQQFKAVEAELSHLKSVQEEIRSMNELLITLTNELKHANEHLSRHEKKIEAIEAQPGMRLNRIVTAVIAALTSSTVAFLLGSILG